MNQLRAEIEFDQKLEEAAEPYYEKTGRRSLPPGAYFRMLFIGYFKDISSQRCIARRCGDNRSHARFVGYAPGEQALDHSPLSLNRERLPMEVHAFVFELLLDVAKQNGLVSPLASVRKGLYRVLVGFGGIPVGFVFRITQKDHLFQIASERSN